MARSIALAGTLVLLLGCARERLSDEEVAHAWLARDCTVTGQRELETDLRSRGEALEKRFLVAFSAGPPSASIEIVLANVDAIYKRRQDRLKTERIRKTSVEAIDAARNLSLADERRKARDRTDYNYRAAAVRGLAIIGRPEGMRLVRRVAADRGSPYGPVARYALEHLPK